MEHEIADFGERIDGARKHLARAQQRRGGTVAVDERPAWLRKYSIGQIVKGYKEGQWEVTHDGQPVRDPRTWSYAVYLTQEEAERAVPLLEVRRNHCVLMVQRDPGVYGIYRRVSKRKQPLVKGEFSSREAAERYMEEHAAEVIEHRFSFPEKPWLDRIERIGEDYRGGQDVGPSDFQEKGGWRGGQFGNWNQGSDGQAALNHAYDAMLDLAHVLEIPPKAVSLHGELAIAFGARGHGGIGAFRAHYEPDYAVVNLTKIRGAGCLAHEWFHALDHYLARMDSKASSERIDGQRFGVTGHVSDGFSAKSLVRPEMRAAFNDVMKKIMVREEKREIQADPALQAAEAARSATKERLEVLRKAMVDGSSWNKRWRPPTAEQLEKWDQISTQILAGDPGERTYQAGRNVRSIGHPTWTTLVELNEIYKKSMGRSFVIANANSDGTFLFWRIHNFQRMDERAAAAAGGVQETRTVSTEFVRNAQELDKLRASDYWSLRHELVARAFEAYVQDWLMARGERSDYLVHGATNWGPFKPYPEGAERAEINAAFDRLFETMRTRETEKGVEMYRVTAAAAAPPLTAERVRRALPGAIVQDVAHGWDATLSNGHAVRVRVDGAIELDEEAFRRTYGRDLGAGERALGSYLRLDRESVIRLAKGGVDSQTLDHEIFHLAMSVALTDEQRRSVLELYGTEERAAEAYSAWPSSGPHQLFREICDFFRRIAEAFGWIERSAEREAAWVFDTVRAGAAFRQPVRQAEVSGAIYASDAGAEKAPVFYSELQRAVSNRVAPLAAHGEQWLQFLQGRPGVKAAELKWTGLNEFLTARKSERVTREEVQAHLQQNEVRVLEIMKGGKPATLSPSEMRRAMAELTKNGGLSRSAAAKLLDRALRGEAAAVGDLEMVDMSEDILDRIRTHFDPGVSWGLGFTRWAALALPGGENYRELLLMLPAKGPVEPLFYELRVNGALVDAGIHRDNIGAELVRASHENPDAEVEVVADGFYDEKVPCNAFASRHWDEPGVLVHARLSERVEFFDERPMLFIEELQSDWGQTGRLGGFMDVAAKPAAGAAPKAPFVEQTEQWTALALKRIVRWAAEHGFERVGWTTGDHQAALNGLGLQVDTIEYARRPVADGTYTYGLTFIDQGRSVLSKTVVPDQQLTHYVGDDVAARIRKQADAIGPEVPGDRVTGLDVGAGGHGFRAFYDEIVPAVMARIGRPWGVKVDEVEISLGFEVRPDPDRADRFVLRDPASMDIVRRGFRTERAAANAAAAPYLVELVPRLRVHAVEISPEMRRDVVRKGQPLFRTASPPMPEGLSPANDHDLDRRRRA